jgi:LPS-assembly lipoprotein
MRRRFLKNLLGMAAFAGLTGSLAGCGFQLRGQAALPFNSAWVVAPDTSNVANALRRSLSSQLKLAPNPTSAQLRITLDRENYGKRILALSGGGKVREFRLEYQVYFSVTDSTGKVLVEPTEIHLSSDFSFTDAQVLAKEAEEASLKRAMEQDALRQILRRLAYLQTS